MRILSERMQRLWEEWEIRGMVLVSLTVQITLILFGARRKYIRQTWIQVVVWSMYMIADSVAMFSLGKLSDEANNIDSRTTTSSTNNNDIVQLKALWAPLLILHLGGPDTITAYSVEDVRLYLRHVFGLLLNVCLGLYIFLRFWTGAIHRIPALAFLLFVAGIAKYGERSWVLWRANEVFPKPQLPIRFSKAKSILHDLGPDVDPDVKLLAMSYIWLQALVPCLAGSKSIDNDLTPPEITEMIWANDEGKSAFKIFEFQSGFLYEMLYTKANNIYTTSGCIVRLVSVVCVVTVLVGFSTFGGHNYSEADVCITYILLVGAVVLEVYALKLMIYSDWVLVWMSKHCKNPFWRCIFQFLSPKLFWRGKRWASSLPTLSLFNASLYDKKPAILYQISKQFDLHEKFKAFACRRDVDNFGSVKKLIMEEVKHQLGKFGKWDYLHEYPAERGERALSRDSSSRAERGERALSRDSSSRAERGERALSRDSSSRAERGERALSRDSSSRAERGERALSRDSSSRAERGERALSRDSSSRAERGERALSRDSSSRAESGERALSRDSSSRGYDRTYREPTRDSPNWCIEGRSFDISIVIWHIATSYCYYARDEESSSREGAKLMSDYMMYLLVSRSHMLGDNVEPCDLSAIIGCYAQLMEDTIRNHGSSRDNDYSKLICESFLTYKPEVCTSKYGRNRNMGSLEYGRIPMDACELVATFTSEKYKDTKWKLMSQVWSEMLCYAAAKCKYETHLRELIRGGEFISQVWLLLLIHGLVEETPTNFLRTLFIQSAIPGMNETARPGMEGTAWLTNLLRAIPGMVDSRIDVHSEDEEEDCVAGSEEV